MTKSRKSWDEKNSIYEEAIWRWGPTRQILQTLEELTELQKELIKFINRGKDNKKEIAEETADVLIMLDQLMYIFKNALEVDEIVEQKLTRLEEKLISKRKEHPEGEIKLPFSFKIIGKKGE